MLPGDPVALILGDENLDKKSINYIALREKYKLDKPLFYFSISNTATPQKIDTISNETERKYMYYLLAKYGNWSEVEPYYASLIMLSNQLTKNAVLINNYSLNTIDLMHEIWHCRDERIAHQLLQKIGNQANINESLIPIKALSIVSLRNLELVIEKSSRYKNYIPSIAFHGVDNQLHFWLFGDKPWFSNQSSSASKGFIRGDFGIDFVTKKDIRPEFFSRLVFTSIFTLFSIFLSTIIAIPLGVYSAQKKGTLIETCITFLLFLFYSIPAFWLATLLIFFLGNNEYVNIFETYGISSLPNNAPFLDRIIDVVKHLLLPLVCVTYSNIAFLSRQTRNNIFENLSMDYIKMVRAKGLSEHKVFWKHAFRNSLLPLITLVANIFPIAVAGSAVVEFIFNLNGIGLWMFEAIAQRNYHIIFTIVIFSSLLTIIGIIVSDILYTYFDPRIKIK